MDFERLLTDVQLELIGKRISSTGLVYKMVKKGFDTKGPILTEDTNVLTVGSPLTFYYDDRVIKINYQKENVDIEDEIILITDVTEVDEKDLYYVLVKEIYYDMDLNDTYVDLISSNFQDIQARIMKSVRNINDIVEEISEPSIEEYTTVSCRVEPPYYVRYVIHVYNKEIV